MDDEHRQQVDGEQVRNEHGPADERQQEAEVPSANGANGVRLD